MKRSLKKVTLLLAVAGLSAGCGGSKDPWETVYPVKGAVKFDGKPIGGAQVFLVPVDSKVPGTIRPSATTGADGSFELGTHDSKDGAPAGDYKVAVIWHELVDTGDGGKVRGDNKLPPRYSVPDTSDLKATVPADPNGVALASFELKK